MKKNNIVIYPAIFGPEPDGSAINVTFPDVPEAITYGRTEEEAVYSANEALGLALASRKDLPKPSTIQSIKPEEKGDYMVMIAVDLEDAKRKIKKPTVKKNTTIPADLDEKAKKAGINFSEVLTNALREKLNE
ncbi:type II toxin-antitoxin system HicB family antitoxin [Lentilactobacillus hilgardii]|uniref:HicB family protein n=1 Tax=Lentilactobacillus hilgardii TaxID=1588 RepID=A0A6P1EAD0_LENHI|nr:type II toxin-antitoxin system HicB family antitoxin [Lentilactobacillus hilgardii]QHB52722.1 HicB family protein [Lentilactobacillus hilgardii]